MDNEKLYLCTIYDKDGKRVGVEVSDDLDGLILRSKFFKKSSIAESYKIWECIEIVVKGMKDENT